ncbi:MAG: AtpZ/AtpI family protein [candidate division KSB1 bacterium]|nr:AtpZ/AtpI family protein [candidate division KSB1 bacterium]
MDFRAIRQVAPYLDLGFRLALMVFIGLYGGYKLDQKLGVLPLFTILGSLLGMGGGLYTVYRAVYGRKREAEKGPRSR